MINNSIPHDEAVEYFEVIAKTFEENAHHLPQAERQGFMQRLRAIQRQLMQGCVDGAIAAALELAEQTHAPAAYLQLAEAQMRNSDAAAALTTLTLLDQLHPAMAEKDLLLGRLLLDLQRYDEAQNILHRAVERKPGLVPAWKILMELSLAEDNHLKAVQLFQEALQHNRGNSHLLALQHCLCRDYVNAV